MGDTNSKPSAPSTDCINLLLIGKSRSGISSTGNTLLGVEKTKSVANSGAGNNGKQAAIKCGNANGANIKVVDIPGLMKADMENSANVQRIFDIAKLCPEGFHAVLMVMSFTGRYTDEEVKTLNMLKISLGEHFIQDRCILIFTHGDNFDTEMSDEEEPVFFADWCRRQTGPAELVALFQECKYRAVLFYNKGAEYEVKRRDSVRQVLSMIENMPGSVLIKDGAYSVPKGGNFVIENKLLILKQDITKRILAIRNKLASTPCAKTDDAKNDPFIKIETELEDLYVYIDQSSQGTDLLDDLRKLIISVRQEVSCLNRLNSQDRATVVLRVCEDILLVADPKRAAFNTLFS